MYTCHLNKIKYFFLFCIFICLSPLYSLLPVFPQKYNNLYLCSLPHSAEDYKKMMNDDKNDKMSNDDWNVKNDNGY